MTLCVNRPSRNEHRCPIPDCYRTVGLCIIGMIAWQNLSLSWITGLMTGLLIPVILFMTLGLRFLSGSCGSLLTGLSSGIGRFVSLLENKDNGCTDRVRKDLFAPLPNCRMPFCDVPMNPTIYTPYDSYPSSSSCDKYNCTAPVDTKFTNESAQTNNPLYSVVGRVCKTTEQELKKSGDVPENQLDKESHRPESVDQTSAKETFDQNYTNNIKNVMSNLLGTNIDELLKNVDGSLMCDEIRAVCGALNLDIDKKKEAQKIKTPQDVVDKLNSLINKFDANGNSQKPVDNSDTDVKQKESQNENIQSLQDKNSLKNRVLFNEKSQSTLSKPERVQTTDVSKEKEDIVMHEIYDSASEDMIVEDVSEDYSGGETDFEDSGGETEGFVSMN